MVGMLIEPSELLVAAVAPGMEDLYPDWTRITVPESPNYRFLEGDEIPYRILMYGEVGRDGIQGRVARFRHLALQIRATGRIDPIEVCRRPDGRLLIVNGNHRAAIALHLGRRCPIVFLPGGELLRRIDTCARNNADYRAWVAPMRRRIAGVSWST